MGCCFSTNTTTTTSSSSSISITSPLTAIIIAVDGSLTEHSVPVTASGVLGLDHLTCFLCSSDNLSFNAPICQLPSDCSLEPDQIYFVLPRLKLGCILTGPDMAALVVKASSALKRLGLERGKDCVITRQKMYASADDISATSFAGTKGGMALGRQGSVRERLGRNASAWAKALRKSFRRTLSKIVEEVDDHQ